MIHTFSKAFVCLAVAFTVNHNLQAEPLRVAVLDSPDTVNWSAGLADFVEAGLQKEGVPTYDRRFVRVWLGERELNRSGVADLKTVRQAKLPTVDLFVRAVASPIGTNQFSLTLEAVRAADATAVISLAAQGRYPQEWLSTVENLVRQMASRLRDKQSAENKTIPGRAITWMPEASLWFFRGLECYEASDYAQAIVAFRKARRWDRHFRLAWLWEARSYQRAGFDAQARRVLEAGQLADKPVGQALERPVLAVVAGIGISPEDQQFFSQSLADSGKVSLLDPHWIGTTTREVDLQLTGEIAARSEAHNAWLVVDQVVFLERTHDQFHIRKQDALNGLVMWRGEAPATTNGLSHLIKSFLQSDKTAGSQIRESTVVPTAASNHARFSMNKAETELARCLDRAMRNPGDVRALLATADACQTWQSDALKMDGKLEQGVEWRVREEFLKQALAAIRQNPGQTNASFWLAATLWRQRYQPEFGIWAGAGPGLPLREQMKPLLDLYSHSTDATNLAETFIETPFHKKISRPVDPRYLAPPFPDEPASAPDTAHQDESQAGEARLAEFRSLVAQNHLARASLLFWDLPSADHFQDQAFQNEIQAFQKLMFEDQQANTVFKQKLAAVSSPGQLAEALSGWKPAFSMEHREEEITGLCDQLAKFSGAQAECRFLESQLEKFVVDYGTLEDPHARGFPNPLVVRLRTEADALAITGDTGDSDKAYELIMRTPEVPVRTRLTTAYDLAVRCYQRGDYFRATELLRELLADDASEDVILSWSGNKTTSVQDKAYALLKQARLFGDGELDFKRCGGEPQSLPAPTPTEMSELEALFTKRIALQSSVGRPTAEKLAKYHEEIKRVEQAMLQQHRDALPAFLAGKLKELGPSPALMGLCAQLGPKAEPLLPQIVAGVLQNDDPSTQANALNALANIGQPAAGTLPVVILAMESDDEIMTVQSAAQWTQKKLGAAPRRTVPYLARLLYHPNAIVAQNAADSLVSAAGLPVDWHAGLTVEEYLQRLENWWENIGSWQAWK